MSGFLSTLQAEKKQNSSSSKKEAAISQKDENKEIVKTEKEYKEALAYIKDAISPAFLKVHQDKIRINNTYAKTFFVYSYPNFLE